MDKKLLEALNNLSFALEEIAEALSKKSSEKPKSATATALVGSDIGTKLDLIDKGIKKIKEDNEKILKNQETLLNISKSQSPENKEINKVTDPKQKQNIKDGLSVILMIAVGVLAIGMAFKMIGGVDFASVLALSIALPLVAIAFEKIAKLKDLNPNQAKNLVLVTIAISLAITLSSFILGQVKPVGLLQLFTTIFIAAAFGAISFGIGKLITAFKDISPVTALKASFLMPFVLVGVSMAIVGSSYFLSEVKPVGLLQLFTTIFIAAAFSVISFGLGKLISAFKGINANDALMSALIMPIVLVGISAAILGSSYLLAQVQPVGLMQIFTTILIGIAFIPISFALPFISKAIEKVDFGKIVMLPILMVTMAGTIWLSSMVFKNVEIIPFGTLVNIVLQSITISLVSIAMSAALYVASMIKLDKAVEGSLVIILIAGTIAVSSLLLNMGEYKNFPSIDWSLGVGLSLLTFGAAVVGLGLIAGSGGALFILAGIPTVLVVAGTIAATSHILSTGNYNIPGMLEWAKATSLLFITFTPILLVLGAIGLASSVVEFFGGDDPFLKAKFMVLQIADTIVGVSFILKKGVYTGGPTKDWAEGISIALGAFAPVYGMLIANKIVGGGIGPQDFTTAIDTISGGIVRAAKALGGKNVFKGGPSKEWSEGVGSAIGAFAPVYGILVTGKIMESLGVGGLGPEGFTGAIDTISTGIVRAAEFFGKNTAAFDLEKVPKKEWGESVGGAIAAFSPALKFITENSGIFSSGEKALTSGISAVTMAIKQASLDLSGGEYDKTIPETWIQNVAKNIKGYIDLSKEISGMDQDFDNMEDAIDSMSKLADGYSKMADSIGKLGGELNQIDAEKIMALKSLNGSIVLLSLMDSDQFTSMMDALEEKTEGFKKLVNLIGEGEGEEGGKTPTSQVRTKKEGSGGKGINDLWIVMSQVDSKLVSLSRSLGLIAQSSGNISSYIDEVKSQNLKLKK